MTKHAARNATPEASALDQLLATERELAALQAAVASECEAMLAAARADAVAIEAAAGDALAREIALLDEQAAEARRALVRAVDEDARRALDRYQQLTDAAVDRLAEEIATEVTGLAPASARGRAA